ncbi:MAG: hypothetical protein ABI903_00520 [Actinomycetota bacterium]
MMVTELSHYLELPEETPGPARRLAADLYGIVRAATAGDAGTAWTSALPCRRRPAHRLCHGRLVVLRVGPPAPIHWQCSVCGDEGLISGWEDSPFDLRRRRLTLAGAVNEVLLPAAVAATLRELQLLDIDCERLVYRIRVDGDQAVMAATDDDLEELVGYVAAEANHAPNRGRQRQLDAALDALSESGR